MLSLIQAEPIAVDATQTDQQEDITVMEELHQEDREVMGLLEILATAQG
nr:hypothetical protein [Okeania sp. SIO2C2]